MAQTYQMKHNAQGTIYSLLTVESDGQMTMTFHGTDRELSQEATLTEDGRIATGGSLFPGLESGKWNKMDDVRCMMDDGRWKMDDGRCKMDDGRGMMDDDCNATLSEREPLTINPEPLTNNQPRPRRQRKPRKPRVERHPSDISHQTSSIDHRPSAISPQTPDIGHVEGRGYGGGGYGGAVRDLRNWAAHSPGTDWTGNGRDIEVKSEK